MLAGLALPPPREAGRGHPARLEGIQAEARVRVAHARRDHDALSGEQSCKKITILDRKDRDLFIDLDLLHDLDQLIDLLKLILIFDP